MKIKNILIAQPAPKTNGRSPFSEIAAKYAVNIDFNPFIHVEGISAKEFRQQRVDFLAHTAVIFTSRTTIDNYFRLCDECRITVPETMKYFCVTESIALYLQKYIIYRKRKIFFGKGSFAELMDVIVKHKEEKFVIPLSEPHKPEIPKLLDKAKIKYTRVILARTVNADVSGVDVAKYDLLAFYSPMEISSLVAHFGDKLNGRANIAVFGASTAKAAVDAGLNVKAVAPTGTVPSLTMAIDHFIGKFNNGEMIDVQEDLQQIIATLSIPPANGSDTRKKSAVKKTAKTKSAKPTATAEKKKTAQQSAERTK